MGWPGRFRTARGQPDQGHRDRHLPPAERDPRPRGPAARGGAQRPQPRRGGQPRHADARSSRPAATSSWRRRVQRRFSTDRFRVYTNLDPVGVELAGALKNVIGIAAGICDGLGFGDNAKVGAADARPGRDDAVRRRPGGRAGDVRRPGRAGRPDHHLLQPARPQPRASASGWAAARRWPTSWPA